MESTDLTHIVVKNRYRLTQQIGKHVFEAIDTLSGQEVAVKMRMSNEPNTILKEGQILRSLRD